MMPCEDEGRTFALDPQGVYVYYALRDCRLLLNGNNGWFPDPLPRYAVRVLDALMLSDEERRRVWSAACASDDGRSQRLVNKLERIRQGDHPVLAPEPRQQRLPCRTAATTFHIYLAQACNQRCRYCFSQGGTFGGPPAVMSAQTSHAVLAFLIRHARAIAPARVGALLFGGEPMLASEAIRILVRGIDAHNRADPSQAIGLLLTTNGTIWDDEVFATFAADRKRHSICVSLDGDRATHDANRPFADGSRGSAYDVSLATIRRLLDMGCFVSATCVVPYPFDMVGAARMLHGIGLPCFEIKQPIFHVYGEKGLGDVFRRDFQTWRTEYLRYSDFFLDHLEDLLPTRIVDRINKAGECENALAGAEGVTLACRVGDDTIGVTADGTLLPCESFVGQPQYALGDVRQGFDADRFAAFEQWILAEGQHRVDHPRCRGCFAKRFCGGGCYAVSLDKTGRLEPQDEMACRFVREQVKIDLYFVSELRRRHPSFYAKVVRPAASSAAGADG